MTPAPADVSAAAVPLARLLALSYRWMIDELHHELAARGWEGLRPAYGFVLLALRDRWLTPTELAAALEVSKQAASKLADTMVTAGLLATDPDDRDARQRRLSLTDLGQELLRDVEEIYVGLERRWCDALGVDTIVPLKQQLSDALYALHDGVLPALRPTA